MAASLAVGLLSSCGADDKADRTAAPSSGPIPDEMCPDGQVPQAAAYDLDDGTFRWVSCTEGDAYRSLQAVTDDAVYVFDETKRTAEAPYFEPVALDPDDGNVLADAPEAPSPDLTTESGAMYRIPVGDLTVTGGQDDSVTVYNADGTVRWNQPGTWVFDDVWAIDDGVVFAIIYGGPEESGDGFSGRLVAYELESGEVRWDYQGDVTREGLDPWRAENGQVFTVGANLEVRDTDTGEVVWKTSYPKSQHPNLRILGADADDDTLYVGFATAFGSGD